MWSPAASPWKIGEARLPSRLFQPMCGTFRPAIAGSSSRTSPPIQPKPLRDPELTSAIGKKLHSNTHTPRNVDPRSTASVIASITPGRARSAVMQAANAPTPGSTMASAFAITSGSSVTTTPGAMRERRGGLGEPFLRRAQIARSIVDECNRGHGALVLTAPPLSTARGRLSSGRSPPLRAARAPTP